MTFFEVFAEAHQKAFEVASKVPKKESGQMYIAIDPFVEDNDSELAHFCVNEFEFLRDECKLSVAYGLMYGIDLFVRDWKDNKDAQREYCRVMVDHFRSKGIHNISYTHSIDDV